MNGLAGRWVKEIIPLLCLSLVVFFVTRYSIIYGAGSDPRYTLIVSQSIIENGTIQLNAYQEGAIWGAATNFDADLNILEYNGRYYNYFPLGPSLLSVPAVLITKAVGWDMRLTEDNINAQRLLSSFSIVLLLWIVYFTTRLLLNWRDSFVITAVSLFGSMLISTLSVALWSLNFSVIFIGLALWLIVRYDVGKSDTVYPAALGILLFLAFFCRAASAAFILPVFLYLLLKDWRQMMQTAVSAVIPLALFLLYSQYEFDSWLPIYYSVARFQVQRTPLWLALAGHLVSPSRGIFVFVPTLILLIPAFFLQRRYLRKRPLIWLCLIWIGLHLFIASRAAIWWGGHSFGPRILTELMLAFTLLTALVWQQGRTHLTAHSQKLWQVGYLLLGITAVYIHTYQGLYNYSVAVWNSVITEHAAPPLTSPYGDLFNWRVSQFVANNEMLCQLEEARTRDALAQAPLLTPYSWGTALRYDVDRQVEMAATAAWLRGESDLLPTTEALFLGWESVDNNRAPHRAAACDTLHILFTIDELPTAPVQFTINTAAFDEQTAVFLLNEQPIGEWTFQQQPKLAAETAVFSINPQYFHPNELNDLTIQLPNARRAGYRDPTRLSLAIADITFTK